MVSKFIMNIFAKGSINIDKGILFVWNNPILFIPLPAFAKLQYMIKDFWGEEGLDLIYWLGRVQGKNSSEIIINRFGIKPTERNFQYFVDGGTFVGMGTMDLQEYNVEKGATVKSDNSSLARVYKELYGESEKPIDHYMRGILSGGTEPLRKVTVDCTETECMATGANSCIYKLSLISKYQTPTLLEKTEINVDEIITKAHSLWTKRQPILKKIFKKDWISFRNGSLYMDKIEGVMIPSYLMGIFNYILMQNNIPNFRKLISEFVKEYVKSINLTKIKITQINKRMMDNSLSELDKFGFGEYRLKAIMKNKIYIYNDNNPYASDFLRLIGNKQKYEDIMAIELLQKFISKLFSKAVKVNEKNTKMKNNNPSLYEVIIGD